MVRDGNAGEGSLLPVELCRTGRVPEWLLRFVPWVAMSLARIDWSMSVRSRIVWSFLLCAVALGIVGMHGLTQGADASQPMGHHVVRAVETAPTSATPDSPAAVSDKSSPGQNARLLTLCLMVLVPAIAVGLWLLVRSRVGGWRMRRVPAIAVRMTELVVPAQPLWRRLSVLRI